MHDLPRAVSVHELFSQSSKRCSGGSGGLGSALSVLARDQSRPYSQRVTALRSVATAGQGRSTVRAGCNGSGPCRRSCVGRAAEPLRHGPLPRLGRGGVLFGLVATDQAHAAARAVGRAAEPLRHGPLPRLGRGGVLFGLVATDSGPCRRSCSWSCRRPLRHGRCHGWAGAEYCSGWLQRIRPMPPLVQLVVPPNPCGMARCHGWAGAELLFGLVEADHARGPLVKLVVPNPCGIACCHG